MGKDINEKFLKLGVLKNVKPIWFYYIQMLNLTVQYKTLPFMKQSTQKEEKVINKVIGILKTTDDRYSFIAQVMLNLALYGGDEIEDGLDKVEAAIMDVKRITRQKEELKVESAA